ncbi:hypothetical protein HUO05_03555 [Vibrio alginolyticus]|uniref:hypothetical protein n=1 Tax=Vibrio alginolyticus TaxID=663 RepID=UPI0015949EA7|nr:hypothetical protein [Vibrio alginolyticus]QKS94349.1 hypothetical protein HUO05_03555 [Vibrio alginolyticus]HCZ9033977.1 hypothetical protein [Vibrio alginolyticus]HCZ9053038.1 hypothetical protein [Vibrio alginolyticus]
MEGLESYLIGIASGVTITLFAKFFIALWDRLFRDIPDVSGKWSANYQFHDNGDDLVGAKEIVSVTKVGRWIFATARMTGDHDRIWKLRGEMRGRSWQGRVYAGDRYTLSGSGVFQLKVWENGRKMEGYMTWWDSEKDSIYSTEYSWVKEVTEESYR